jgi:hypothetical protein
MLWHGGALSSHGTLQDAYLEWAVTGRVLVTISVPQQRGVFAVFCPNDRGHHRTGAVTSSGGDYVSSHRFCEPAQRRERDTVNAFDKA